MGTHIPTCPTGNGEVTGVKVEQNSDSKKMRYMVVQDHTMREVGEKVSRMLKPGERGNIHHESEDDLGCVRAESCLSTSRSSVS
jgi:hypothetical protein